MENPKRYTSSVENSPFLDGDEVDVKAYSANHGASFNNYEQPSGSTTEPKTGPYKEQGNIGNQHQQQQQNQYIDDPVDEMSFGQGEEPEPEEPREERKIPNSTVDRAGSLLALYESFVPGMLANMVKLDVPRIKAVMYENKQVPDEKVREIEKFLLVSNEEIEKAFHFTPEQAEMLKQAIAEVLDYYKLRPSHPLANLAATVATVAVMQYFTVRALKKERDQQLVDFIEQFKVTVPPGMEGAFKKNQSKLKIKPEDEKKARG